MSLTFNEKGSVTLGEAHYNICLQAIHELEALAYLLPIITSNETHESPTVGFMVRGIAARSLSLSNVLLAAIFDDAETTDKLANIVLVTP